MVASAVDIPLSTLLEVAGVVGTVIGAAVAFALFRYRLDRHDERFQAHDQEIAEVRGDVTKLQLWRAQQRGAEKARRGDPIEETQTWRRDRE